MSEIFKAVGGGYEDGGECFQVMGVEGRREEKDTRSTNCCSSLNYED